MARGEWAKTKRLIDAAVEILKAENPMTVRQCFYRLVSAALIENCIRDYRRVSTILTKARNDRRIRFEWIVDRSRPEYGGAGWTNLQEFAEWEFTGYRRDNWQDQSAYVELWTEKDAVTGSIEPIADEWGVTMRALRGFNSTTGAHKIARTFRVTNNDGKQIHVFYLGDFDPSGKAIETDAARRVREYNSGPFTIRRLAIHKEDIAKFRLPPLRVKAADPRAGGFVRRYGRQAVELDALPPTELRRRLQAAIRALVDLQVWDRALRIEQAERETTKRIHAVLTREVQKELNRR